jgi:hypothetical protein
MIKHFLLPAAVILVGWGAAPAMAQQNDRALIVYGNDKCPEGMVCVRAPESERYRIPKSLRSGPLAPQDEPWARRAESVSGAGAATGTGSCSNVGGGGWTGCLQKQMRNYRADRKQQAATEGESPLPK